MLYPYYTILFGSFTGKPFSLRRNSSPVGHEPVFYRLLTLKHMLTVLVHSIDVYDESTCYGKHSCSGCNVAYVAMRL